MLALSSTPASVQQNASANPNCQWEHQLFLREQAGVETQLTRFLAGGFDLSGQIQQFFGTTRLAPFGTLATGVCWNSGTPLGLKAIEIDGASDDGVVAGVSSAVTLTGPAATTATMTVSPISILLNSPTNSSSIDLTLTFSAGTPPWTISVFPNGPNTGWLTLSQASGSGSATVTLQASGAGLQNGIYSAMLVVQASAAPQFFDVPITFQVGAASGMFIGGISNGASFKQAFAPGSVMSIFGTDLAPAEAIGSLPLPLNLAGVSVTVNGIPAPLYYASPTQLNVQIPYETGAGRAFLGINNNVDKIAVTTFDVAASAPGIFDVFIDTRGAAVHSAQRGAALTLFVTGVGDVLPAVLTGSAPVASIPRPRLPVTLTVGGVTAPVQFVGIPSWSVGVTQVNFTIPQNAPAGLQPVIVTVGSVASAPVNLTIE